MPKKLQFYLGNEEADEFKLLACVWIEGEGNIDADVVYMKQKAQTLKNFIASYVYELSEAGTWNLIDIFPENFSFHEALKMKRETHLVQIIPKFILKKEDLPELFE